MLGFSYDIICHGIPNKVILSNGDILNIDVTVILDGWYGDTSRMYYIGYTIFNKSKLLIKVTYESMIRAIKIVKPKIKLKELGKIIIKYVNKFGYTVVREYCGHGIGKNFHMYPNVLHYYDLKSSILLQEKIFFTIEPMINFKNCGTRIIKNKWRANTIDFYPSSQFEHTIGVTKYGYENFTQSPKNCNYPPYYCL